jgi:hypothetical protein
MWSVGQKGHFYLNSFPLSNRVFNFYPMLGRGRCIFKVNTYFEFFALFALSNTSTVERGGDRQEGYVPHQ